MGQLNSTSSAILMRTLFLPMPVVTDKITLYVESGATPLVMKLDVLGLDGDSKQKNTLLNVVSIYIKTYLFHRILI